MRHLDNLGSPSPDIPTREELDRREAARQARERAPQPSPSTPDGEAVRGHFETEDRERSAELEEKFAALKVKIDVDQAFARLEGQARAHFQHSR